MTASIIDKKKVDYLVIKYVCAVQCTQLLRYMCNKLDCQMIIRCKVIIRYFIYIIYCSR